MHVAHNRYYTHEELSAWLHTLAETYPRLARLASIGQSHRQRQIWAMTLTNFASGMPQDKPGFYIDANNHGEEIITSAVALYTIDYILSNYGHDPLVTELLDTRVIYILPRLNPDGAEISMTTPYRTVGNGHYLPWEEQITGLHLEDINNDHKILQMRIPDPRGEWKVSPLEPRLLTLRQPGEVGGAYYRLIPEGMLRDWDGVSLPIVKPRHGNLNRQFPINWLPEYGEYGAGETPLNEPEAAAMARFIQDHPNITGVQAYHSHGGLILRPSGYKRDSELPPDDVALLKKLGQVGTQLTGYPLISTFEDFTPNLRKPRHGTFTDWLYEHLGIPAFSTEVWDIETEIGLEKPQFFSTRPHSEAEQAAFLRWTDEHSPQAFTDWQPFAHPQLGPIELGGWDPFYIHRNPPAQFIEQVAHPNCLFTLRHALASPQLQIRAFSADHLDAGLFRLAAVVENLGYLATNLTSQALEANLARPVQIELELGEHVELLMGQPVVNLGHLAGREERQMPYDAWRRPWGEPAARAEWLVRCRQRPGQVTIRATSEKGGKARATIQLNGT
jgi:hypothetical protein